MRRVDQLILKSLDGELDELEAMELVNRLRGDPARAHGLLEHQRLLEATAELGTPLPPADFTARTMQRLTARPEPHTSMWTSLLRPRATLRLGILHLAASGALAVLAVLGAVRLMASPPEPAPLAALVPAEAVPLVRFTYRDPGARSVAVAGDFNAWSAESVPMRRLAGGTWEALVPLPRGRHQYMFVVDGETWVSDPSAAQVIEDEFGGRNGVIEL